jgi:hypothetical protein
VDTFVLSFIFSSSRGAQSSQAPSPAQRWPRKWSCTTSTKGLGLPSAGINKGKLAANPIQADPLLSAHRAPHACQKGSFDNPHSLRLRARPAAASMAARTRSFSRALKRRRTARSESSGSAVEGDGTVRLRMSMRLFLCALCSEPQEDRCLIIIDTEGRLSV